MSYPPCRSVRRLTAQSLSSTTAFCTALSVLFLGACTQESATVKSEKQSEQSSNVIESAIGDGQLAGAKNVYFGDLHIHTKNSFDAYIFNVRSTPDDVYRFAKGESVRHPSGFDITLGGEPLDFVATTDHGRGL